MLKEWLLLIEDLPSSWNIPFMCCNFWIPVILKTISQFGHFHSVITIISAISRLQSVSRTLHCKEVNWKFLFSPNKFVKIVWLNWCLILTMHIKYSLWYKCLLLHRLVYIQNRQQTDLDWTATTVHCSLPLDQRITSENKLFIFPSLFKTLIFNKLPSQLPSNRLAKASWWCTKSHCSCKRLNLPIVHFPKVLSRLRVFHWPIRTRHFWLTIPIYLLAVYSTFDADSMLCTVDFGQILVVENPSIATNHKLS